MGLEEFIAEKKFYLVHENKFVDPKKPMVYVDDLREFVKGRVLVDGESLKILVGMTLGLGYHGKPITRTDLDTATDKLVNALVAYEIPASPTTGAKQ